VPVPPNSSGAINANASVPDVGFRSRFDIASYERVLFVSEVTEAGRSGTAVAKYRGYAGANE